MRAATLAGGAAVAYHAGKSTQAGKDQQAMQQPQATAPEEEQASQQAPPPPPAAPAAGGMSPDAINALKELGQLHEQGILTDEEFATQKAKLLGG